MRVKTISQHKQSKNPDRDYNKASIPMLSNWSKEGDEIARLQLLKLCKRERK